MTATYRIPRGYEGKETLAVHHAQVRAPGTGFLLEKQGLRWCLWCCADKTQKGGQCLPGNLFQCADHRRKVAA